MKIRCTRPNASMNMNGIAFEPHQDGGMVSVNEVATDMASIFLSVDGFFAAEMEKEVVKTPPASSERSEKQDGSADTEAAAPAPVTEKNDASQPVVEAGKESAKEGKPKGGKRAADKNKE